MFAQLSLKRSTLMVGTASVLFSFGAAAHAQFNPSSARASMGGSGGQGLLFSVGGGMTLPTGEMHLTAASEASCSHFVFRERDIYRREMKMVVIYLRSQLS